MESTGEPRRFIERVQKDDDLKKQLLEAFELGSEASLGRIVEVAARSGFEFSADDFRATMRQILRARFEAGELDLEELVTAKDPPESSCASGCLSYTKSWHPDNIVLRNEPRSFIEHVQENDGIKKRLLAIFESGGSATMDRITELAAEAGFRFSADEFQATMRQNLRERYQAGELDLEELVTAKDPPMSSCASGCLSYTKSWHPDSIVFRTT